MLACDQMFLRRMPEKRASCHEDSRANGYSKCPHLKRILSSQSGWPELSIRSSWLDFNTSQGLTVRTPGASLGRCHRASYPVTAPPSLPLASPPQTQHTDHLDSEPNDPE